MNSPAGTLYIVGTPIGNLQDMPPRAIQTLKQAHLIAAEDTRHTKKLLSHFDIHTPMISYQKFSERAKLDQIIGYLTHGKDIALVSDAGMPGISDPGEILIKETIKHGITVIPIPGPSAFVLALAASGLPSDRFVFEGFLPRKSGARTKKLLSLLAESRTIIFYETGKRITQTLLEIEKTMGHRRCAIARELTKTFEEIRRGTVPDVLKQISSLKGEFTVILEGRSEDKTASDPDIISEIKNLQKHLEITPKEAIKLTAERLHLAKRDVYDKWIKYKGEKYEDTGD